MSLIVVNKTSQKEIAFSRNATNGGDGSTTCPLYMLEDGSEQSARAA